MLFSSGWLAGPVSRGRREDTNRGNASFLGPEKIREIAPRDEARGDLESRQLLEHAIDAGRGGLYLRLTPEPDQQVNAELRR
jgi:hypothetical protein